MVTYLGDLYLSNGDRIVRPGGYLAFLVIASAANLIIGLLLAVIRIALLLVTTILAVGRTDVSTDRYGVGGRCRCMGVAAGRSGWCRCSCSFGWGHKAR